MFFPFSIEASASHGSEGIAAGDVRPTEEEDVKAFLNHIVGYYNQVTTQNAGDNDALTRELVIYGRQIRQEGAYKHSATNMYSMGINERGIVTNHAGHPGLFGYKFGEL